VFFDALGPPWPKHPCTDNPRIPIGRFSAPREEKQRGFDWQAQGWEPVVIERVEKVKGWARLKLQPISSLRSGFIVRATPWRAELLPGLPAHIKPLDASGIGRISVLHQTPREKRVIEAVLVHRTFVACNVQIFDKAREGDGASVLLVADATYRHWELKRPKFATVCYPAFVDFRIAKKWVEKAAALGSDAAKTVLRNHPHFINIR
jgi:hypothetical protein